MRRRIFNLAIVLSLLLFLAVVALYIRAFACRDELHTSVFRHDCLIATFPHHLHVILADHAGVYAYPTSMTYGLHQYPARPEYWQPRLSPTGVYWEISIPFWLPLLFAGSTPLWVASRGWKRRTRARVGLCASCGYDLRASPDRCPECGTEVKALAAR